ncbi:SDR family NAD(P)-dependent oxidoreductase [Pseudomaricurvus sp.]|uniref:SDR family NAD(P)-dependent oxidoreductase n=1 Tax=Pseudomaricurvus sp. TaxID=2004510 RepID=UPI003F6B6C9F
MPSTPLQQPIASPFTRESNSEDVAAAHDLTGKVAVVTGSTAGLGIETARVLALQGAEVFVIGRNQKNGDNVVERLKSDTGNSQIKMLTMDLNALSSVRDFANQFLDSGKTIDILINNAGVMASPFETTEYGFESQLFVNYVSHLLLSTALAPCLLKSSSPRVVSLTSLGHHMSPVILDDLNFEHREYDKWRAYGQSKTATALLAVYLHDQLGKHGVVSASVHPGVITETSLGRYLSPQEQQAALSASSKSQPKTLSQGAATTLWAATSPLLETHGGSYLEDCNIAAVVEKPNFQYGVLPYAISSEKAEQLVAHVENALGEKLLKAI